MTNKKQTMTDSDRLDAILELLEKIDWKLWEIYQRSLSNQSQPESERVIKR